jgi:hypothetical protein
MKKLIIVAACLNLLCWTVAEASNYSDAVLSQGAAGYWEMNTTVGDDPNLVGGAPVMDIGSAVVRGTPSLGPADGFSGFGGANKAFTYVNNASSVMTPVTGASAVSSDLGSVSFWINTTATSYNGSVGMLWYGGASGDGFGLDKEMHVDIRNAGNIQFFIVGESGPAFNVDLNTAGTYNDGLWHHVAATWSNSGTALYLDGGAGLGGETILGGSSNIDGESFSGSASRFGKPRSNIRYYEGIADELAIFNRQLSASEVAFQYKSAFVPEPGSITLALTSLLGLMCFRRRRRR